MATLTPREPYSKEELAKLYPGGLELKLVQVVRFPAPWGVRDIDDERLICLRGLVIETWYAYLIFLETCSSDGALV